MSSLWYLDNVDFHDLLCPHKLKEYAKDHPLSSYKKGEFIYLEHETAKNIYLITTGRVKIGYYTEDGQEVVKSILGKGEIFGEMALLGEDKRKDFAQCLNNNTVLCPMDIDSVHLMMREYKQFSLKIYKLIGFRIKKLERRLDQLVFKDVKTRLLDFIHELAVERGQKLVNNTIRIDHFYTQKDIADLIGTSRPTVNTLLNELKEDGIIDFSRKQILLKEVDNTIRDHISLTA